VTVQYCLKLTGESDAGEFMKDSNQLPRLLKRHREAAGLSQRSLARKLGVEASHVAFIEAGRRRPSLKLVRRLADTLGFDRQDLFILAHPEAKALIVEAKLEKAPKRWPSWQRFIKNQKLLAKYNVTNRELRTLEHLSSLGTMVSVKEFLTILTLIRDIPASP